MTSPLSRLASLKIKLGALVGLSVLVTAVVATIGASHGVEPWLVIPVSVAVALIVTQVLATGMTAPLREMTIAAGGMARGDYRVRVSATGADEVAVLARAFNEMAADLADVDRHRRDLVANVSHELRTPAAALRAVLENMVDGVTPADQAGLASVLAQSERLSDLVTDLLALSRLDAGITPLGTDDVVVRTLIDQAVADLALTGRGVPVEVQVTPADLTVRGEPTRLQQAVTNLIDNAMRHTGAGGAVRVRARREDEATQPRWVLDVADDGPGIAPQDRDRIFARFGTASEGGTGIGLAITRWVAEIHGGRVNAIDPEPGRGGARLRLNLPVTPPTRTRLQTLPQAPISLQGNEIIAKQGASVPAKPILTPSPAIPATTPTTRPPRDASPPVIDGIFGRLWPDRDTPGRPRLLLAALGVGLLAAVILPNRTGGLATTLVLLAGAATLIAAPQRRTPKTVVCAVLGVGLALIPTLRAAPWLIPLSLLAGAVVAVVGLTPARSLTALIGSAVSWPLAGLRGLPWLGRMLTPTHGRRVNWALARTIALSAVLLLVFGALFASADAVMAHWISLLMPNLSIDSAVARAFVFAAVAGIVLAGVYIATNPIADAALTLPPGRPARHTWEWTAPTGIVIATYVAFIAAQASAWFGGHGYVERATGLTYAEYVHQGFGQLVVATALTLGVVGFASRRAPRGDSGDRLRLRLILGTLCLLTLLVAGSALWRMNLYQEAYGFTAPRLVVDTFEIWVAAVVLMVMAAGIRLHGKWIPRAAALTGAGLVLALGLMNPDAWVANRNLDLAATSGKFDADYLAGLSADAVPTLIARLPDSRARCVIGASSISRAPADDALEWNLGRSRARHILAKAAWSQSDLVAACPSPASISRG
jgi:two-component system sensor histidine kinase BaeS